MHVSISLINITAPYFLRWKITAFDCETPEHHSCFLSDASAEMCLHVSLRYLKTVFSTEPAVWLKIPSLNMGYLWSFLKIIVNLNIQLYSYMEPLEVCVTENLVLVWVLQWVCGEINDLSWSYKVFISPQEMMKSTVMREFCLWKLRLGKAVQVLQLSTQLCCWTVYLEKMQVN